MAIKSQTYGLDAVVVGLERAGNLAEGIAKAALYEGAGVMADAMNASLDEISTQPFFYAHHGWHRLPSPEQLAAVKSVKFGIGKFEGSGAEISTVVGFSGTGYVQMLGKSYPAAMLLRSIQSGTSFMHPQPVVRRAINRHKAAATRRMRAVAEERLKTIFKIIKT